MLSSILIFISIISSTTQALYFAIFPLVASDTTVPSEGHSISFTVCDPMAVYEQGGSAPANCTISWNDCDVPTCWTECSANDYFARVTAGSYNGADDFSLDIWQEFVYELANHNNATFPIVEDQGKFGCSRVDQSTICTIQGDMPFNQTLQTFYGGATPNGGPICPRTDASS